MSDNINALSASMRPVDALSAAGLGQLTGLVAPLQQVLDRMQGNASSVHAFLDSWMTVSNRITQIQGQLGQAVAQGTADWRGASADQYRARADSFSRSLTEFASAAKESAAIVQLTAEVVGHSRSAANALITDMIQRLISLVRHLMALEGGMTATVLAQAGDLVSTFAKPVANIERQAQMSVANAAKPINNLITTIGAITRLWDSYSSGGRQRGMRPTGKSSQIQNQLTSVGNSIKDLNGSGRNATSEQLSQAMRPRTRGATNLEEPDQFGDSGRAEESKQQVQGRTRGLLAHESAHPVQQTSGPSPKDR